MKKQIRQEIAAIEPLDVLEHKTIVGVLAWIDSGAELCRLQKPATPPVHLVAYFPVVDGEYVLLVDHINAQKWLPTGGHVEPGEHPRTTARREAQEELGITAEFITEQPVLLTQTETVGLTAGHTDVSIWYALKGDRSLALRLDHSEFLGYQWFHHSALPDDTDPHLARFMQKLVKLKTGQSVI
ncbi:NUDIX domain-containing protein [Marinicella meishanensis]|uniref:NUDIX domain-containing protein n=1 Tax=Marinicella meishanensis TaxID=2873263 RepID=UPI001CBD8F4A|nr:NUDIX hydrolase [Marinicella sp. NBU2979]